MSDPPNRETSYERYRAERLADPEFKKLYDEKRESSRLLSRQLPTPDTLRHGREHE